MLKKNYNFIIIPLLIASFISSIYIYVPNLPSSIDSRLRDFMFTLRGEIKPKSDSVAIVDIDEKSLQTFGQWPWSRDILSKILYNLTSAEVAVIGFDIVFAEEDRTSPHKIFKKFDIKQKNIPNFDLDFSQAIANTPTILGYQFELTNKKYINKNAPSIQTIFIEKNKKQGENYLITAQGTILNIPILQDSSYSSGFFNNIPDDTGIIRSIPLIISYEDEIYPSLSLETLRIGLGINKIYINYDENGIKNLQVGDFMIPTDRYGRLLINFRGKEKTFKYISALDIYNNSFNKEDITNKIILIGTSAAALMDLRATPFESIFPGVEIHANAIDNIISQDFLYKASWVEGVNIVIIFVLSFFTFFIIRKIPIWLTPIFTILFLFVTIYYIYYLMFNTGVVLNILFPIFSIILSGIISLIIGYFYEIKKKEEIKNKFASKVSKDVMEELLKNIDDNSLKAQNKEVSIFFSDIRGFTNISEKINKPELLIKYLNQYMTPMSKIIIKNNGTIDKYIGDSIMAYWNAPFDIDNHADKAVISALEQLEELKKLNIILKDLDQPQINIGIGITTGIATVGEIGSIGRSDYTIIGDNVNLGSRIESLCKFYGCNLIISENTKEKLKENYIFRYLDFVQVKGKEIPIKLWEVISLENDYKNINNELEKYSQAIKEFENKELEKALAIFHKLNTEYEKKKIYDIYIHRCEEFIKNKNFSLLHKHEFK
ncbi:adenylate/guanylate cyclase domain-containing protein [bacterium]|jgi:adenylate cyclase|nr:adenylate/guanylate cyclase domain-containing protein [bacterium]